VKFLLAHILIKRKKLSRISSICTELTAFQSVNLTVKRKRFKYVAANTKYSKSLEIH